MVRAALKNPYAVVALSLVVVILGVVSFRKMVVDIFPKINIPVVAVATFYKGMAPKEIEGGHQSAAGADVSAGGLCRAHRVDLVPRVGIMAERSNRLVC